MRYCQTVNIEKIAVHPLDNIDSTHFVELIKYGNEPVFAVTMYDGEDVWIWEFEMYTPTNYERVKMSIFDAIFACDTMIELAVALDSIFRDEFEDVLIADECDCCEGCEGCESCGSCEFIF